MALSRLIVAKIPFEDGSDDGESEALYLRHPNDNGRRTLLSPAKGALTGSGGLQTFTSPPVLHDLPAELNKPGMT